MASSWDELEKYSSPLVLTAHESSMNKLIDDYVKTVDNYTENKYNKLLYNTNKAPLRSPARMTPDFNYEWNESTSRAFIPKDNDGNVIETNKLYTHCNFIIASSDYMHALKAKANRSKGDRRLVVAFDYACSVYERVQIYTSSIDGTVYKYEGPSGLAVCFMGILYDTRDIDEIESIVMDLNNGMSFMDIGIVPIDESDIGTFSRQQYQYSAGVGI